jgi:flagellar protein FliS
MTDTTPTEGDDMARMAAVRNAYSSDTVVTTPERLITMLYDRLCRDLVSAEAAIERKDRTVAHEVLVHAQEIVFELLSALDVDAWEGAPALSNLYTWLLRQLVEANTDQDAAKVQHCRTLVEPLAEAWHQAANEVATAAFGTAV